MKNQSRYRRAELPILMALRSCTLPLFVNVVARTACLRPGRTSLQQVCTFNSMHSLATPGHPRGEQQQTPGNRATDMPCMCY